MAKIFTFKFIIILLAISSTPNLLAQEVLGSIVRGPYLQNVTPSTVAIHWETMSPTSSELKIGSVTLGSTELSNKHSVIVNNLLPGTKYSYQILGTNKKHSFSTAISDVSSPYKFTVWGDSQDNPKTFKKIADAMLAFAPNFAVGVGDYVNNGMLLSQWDERLFSPAADFLASVPSFLALGNHDYGLNRFNEWDFSQSSQGLKNFQSFFNGPAGKRTYYSFNYGNSHFIVLDPNLNQAMGTFDISPGSEQYDWLIKDLESDASKCATFRFVIFHEPAFISYWDGGYWDGEPSLRENLVPLLEQYKITIAFSGHAHVYERGILNEVTYITTGGGGGNLDQTQYRIWDHILVMRPIHHYIRVKINKEKLEYFALTSDGEIIDQDVLEGQSSCQ